MTAEARIVPVILCGGAGTRLWPSSRESYPKQFLPLLGDRSTFEDTLARISDRSVFADPMIVTAEGFRFLVADQMTRSNVSGKLVLEPMRRDSGPAIAVAAELAHALDPSTVMLVLAADHVVMDHAAFVATAKAGLAAAQKGAIVTFGVVPSHPATGYGYIQPGETIADNVRAVANFIEKPDLERAEKLVADGFLWNSGNFMFRADAFLAELARFQPAMAEACRKAAEGVVPETVSNLTFLRMDAEAFASSPAKSVDYAVMELTDRAAVVNAPYDWSDLGSWDALWQIAPKDENGNVTRGSTFTVDANNCLIDGEGIAAAVVGLDNIAVITTKDAVLVARRDVAGQMKTLHALVASSHRKLVDEHIRMYRPWGWYQQVDIGERFQVKRLHVTPGKRLSLQKHYHRSEHWTVVKGTATVTLGEETRTVHENESVYLPIGIWHRLANDGKIPLEIIEVQTGSYLGEDDIVRTEDDFKRS